MEAGIDSLAASELQRGLSEQLSTEFEATLLFDHPTIEAIVAFYAGSGPSLLTLSSQISTALGKIQSVAVSKEEYQNSPMRADPGRAT